MEAKMAAREKKAEASKEEAKKPVTRPTDTIKKERPSDTTVKKPEPKAVDDKLAKPVE